MGKKVSLFFIEKRAQLNMSFGWIFALIAGAVILFLTIYGISSFMDVSQQQQTSAQAQDLQVLLNPLQTSFSSAVSSYIERNTPTRIHNRCSVYGDFGDQIISISEESVDGWTDRGVPSRFENKYIFSNSTVQGERFYIFSKPFNFPYKVADVVYLTSSDKKYCFKSPPEDIENELGDLSQNNLVVGCSGSTQGSVEVCFSEGNSGCDVNVDYSGGEEVSSGSVSKNGQEMDFYSDALMYSAIFSDEDTYECQLGRLFKRSQNLASVYLNKYSYVDKTSCQADFRNDLNSLNASLGFEVPDDPDNLKISDDYLGSATGGSQLTDTVGTLRQRNDNTQCALW